MESGGSLRVYNAKYWETYNKILDCPTNLAIAQYKREDDAATATATEKANLIVADRRVAGKVHSKRPTNAPCSEEEDAKRKLRARIGITIVFKILIYLILSEIQGGPYIRWLAKLGDTHRGFNSRYRCTFHEERGHRTENCVLLKQHLEELVVAGHLDQYINGGIRAAPQGQAEPNGLAILDEAPQGVINVILGIIEPTRVCELWGMIKKAEHMREVLSVQLAIKKGKTEVKDVLTFSSKDFERIQMPHNDALVVTLRVKDFDIKRILIDQGSSVEIMYYDVFKQMKLENKDLALATSSLVGLNS
ncbi:uncharacterized protein LOC114274132 [Camellia sinensis]|uniref:uncharacterized protein LOC114274132 n=1 Tax=Camellia sinensis TaxID=4442 RepID=UPI0010359400|nr:uncharacterized protein LOC114274132 [Camellia sinensis]